ncbi:MULTISPECIES: LytR/AlgR family response regulator transcription factor [Tenacibaculum]|uniref:LytR/AlgR family response regulator transcription factor n=1 Tax=Tenacibaculum TaxID=104267 RepID=UPI001F0AB899|nr:MULTISPECIES: LytTR family DNA-binding domain-containing protein [Tenacibaculum]MCH3881816.1 LytTR family DNA-binding domain-containing protein [Tenacibaculum aquimarinum]MDO6598616.1 LytTR family DNA-binding domain-containing protein [Tenacibaculum sp. 1_MG-2023]
MTTKITCVIVDDEPVARDVLESFVEKIPNLKLIKSCKNAMEAFQIMNTQKVDLFFLDINMPEISGLSLAKSIPKKTKIIFTTAYREYAVDGFDLQAVDYLLKPIAFDRFLQAVNKFFETTVAGKVGFEKEDVIEKNDFIFVRSERKMVKINFDEILFIESLSDYIKITLQNSVVVTRETISNIESKLPVAKFMRTHRSFIISLPQITSYTNEFIEIGKKAIPISRSYKETVLQKLAEV